MSRQEWKCEIWCGAIIASNATTTGGFALGRVAGAAFGWPLRHLASGGMRYLGQEEAGARRGLAADMPGIRHLVLE